MLINLPTVQFIVLLSYEHSKTADLYMYSSQMGSFIPVDSYQASVITKYNTKIQVQKKYNIHNNNPINPSAKLKQTMYVNPYIVQPHWNSCIRK